MLFRNMVCLTVALADRFCKLWDTETGECISRFSSRKVPYCVKFNPEEDKQHLFVCGTSDKKILCWDTRTGEIIQVNSMIRRRM
jgi:pre-mRNA-processing factor 17